jgi:hypothetical protein
MPNLDPQLWTQRMTLNLTVLQACTIQGQLLLALCHPENTGPSRQIAEDTVAILSRILVHVGVFTEAELRQAFFHEQGGQGMGWAAFEAACVRIEARVAARGVRNPDDGDAHG